MTFQKIIDAYADGSPIGLIVESFNITYKQVIQVLHNHKEENRFKRTFTDDFKKIIAQRDMRGVSRKQIAEELGINVNTVKKACEKFGQVNKGKSVSDNLYCRIDGKFDMKSCPSCKSKRVNVVDEKTLYCMECGDEHIFKSDYVMKINWEYLPEDE